MAKKNPVLDAYNQGKREGRMELRRQVLDLLEEKYMAQGVIRETPLADGILDIVRELSALMTV